MAVQRVQADHDTGRLVVAPYLSFMENHFKVCEVMRIRPNGNIAGLGPRLFIVFMLLLGASGCNEQTAVIANPGPSEPALVRQTFTLGGKSFAIFLPEAAVVSDSIKPDREVYIDFRKNTREQRVLILISPPLEPDGRYDQKRHLTNGANVAYRTEDNTGGGSSGPIAALNGRMAIGSLVISVECTDQDRGVRKPEFCLSYLERLQIVERNL